jgi:HEAT repeat protein
MNRKHLKLIASVYIAVCTGCNKEQSVLAGGRPVEHWVQAARDTSDCVREQAITKLANVGDTYSAVLPVLKTALNDTSPKVRCQAILAIVKYGPGNENAIEPLDNLRARDPDQRVRKLAAKALEKLKTAK